MNNADEQHWLMGHDERSNWLKQRAFVPTRKQAPSLLPKFDPIQEEADYWRDWEANRSHANKSLGEKVAISLSMVTIVGLVVAIAAGWLQ